MKKLFFKVSQIKDDSLLPLIKEINKISCKICINLNKGMVDVENVEENMLETVIGLVNDYFSISSIDIDNTGETATKTNDTEKMTDLEAELSEEAVIRKVGNEYVDTKISALCKSAYWALYTRHAPEKELTDYLQTCISEISLRYSNKSGIEFEVGDIVDINFGSGLPGEVYRNHIHAIVVSLGNEGLVYVVPITKNKTDLTSKSYICFEAPEDAIYYNDYFTGGAALADKTRCIRVERLNSVVGKTKKEFFEKLVDIIPNAFDFKKECIDW